MNPLRVITLAWFCAATSVEAHPISMSNTLADCREDTVMVTLRVMLEDLVLFHGLKANSDTIFNADDLRAAAKKHEAFLLKHFSVRDGEGQSLEGTVVSRDDSAILDKGVQLENLMKLIAVYELRFTPAKPKPAFLTFTQNFGGAKSVVPSIMEFMTLQTGVWIEKPVHLQPGQPHTVALDWDNPPDEAPQNWRELRKKRAEEFQKRLGITSYSGLYSYIYLTDREVRHEILVPLLTFEKWLPIARANPEFLEVAEQEAARQKVAEWFRDRNPVEIDGLPVKPILQRLQFFGLDISDFAQNAEPHRVSAYQARLGIILKYPAKAPPNRVRLTWDSFHEAAPFLRSVVYDHEKDPTEEFFVRDQPRWEWNREGNPPAAHDFKLPNLVVTSKRSLINLMAALLLALAVYIGISRASTLAFGGALVVGAGVLAIVSISNTPTSKARIVTKHAATLLQNIYRAFDYNEKSDVYDALEHSVTGDLLEELFLKIQSGLRMQEQGGAVAHVKRVRIMRIASGKNTKDDRVPVDCTWRVIGTVEHWGHIHTRENEYTARIHLSTIPEDRGRIVAFEVTDEKRVRFETGIRQFEDR
ncbi:hypothetical protein OAJ79_01830 [Verrucomicrobia bacterium]|nr:hypothetical protein [Verrucomicrobiota bacterium]